jgi:hypothetical protein
MGYPAKELKKFIKDNKWFIKLLLLILQQKYLAV